jgi:hypothetical protein
MILMPFNKDTAADCGSKGGLNRWRNKDPNTVRNKQLNLTLTQAEYKSISDKAVAMGLSKTELVIRAVEAYENRPPDQS